MPKLILDEFTNLEISRQLKWQMRKAQQGRCRVCGKPVCRSRRKLTRFCSEHLLAHRKAARVAYDKKRDPDGVYSYVQKKKPAARPGEELL